MTGVDRLKTPEGVPYSLPPISVDDLLPDGIPVQGFEYETFTPQFYDELSRKLLHPQISRFSQRTDILITCPPLDGDELQMLFYFAAPSKDYGNDYADLQEDWKSLFTDQQNTKRLARHRNMKNWDIFEPDCEMVRTFIGMDEPCLIDKIIPVIHLERTNGETIWKFTHPSADQEKIIREQLGDSINPHSCLLTSVGPAFIAAFSYDMTEDWGPDRNYSQRVKRQSSKSMDMGSTQAMALSLMMADELLTSPLMTNLVQYCETGNLPSQSKDNLPNTAVIYQI